MNIPKEFHDLLKAYHTALQLYTKEKYIISVRKLEDSLDQTITFGEYSTQKRIQIYGSQMNELNGEYASVDDAHKFLSELKPKLFIHDTQNVIVDERRI